MMMMKIAILSIRVSFVLLALLGNKKARIVSSFSIKLLTRLQSINQS